jgi:hypothetical protein
MKPRSVAMTSSILDRIFSLVVACALALAPTPGLAAAPAEGESTEAAPTTVSGKVALLRFGGGGPAKDLRSSIQTALQSEGFTVKSVALTIEAAAKKVRCKKGEVTDDCLERLGKWLNKNKRTAADYIVYATITTSETETRAQIVTYDTVKGERIKTWDAIYAKNDFIMPLSLPRVVGKTLADQVVPPGPPTEEEQAMIAELDEPAKTPEEIAAEKRAIEEAEREAAAAQRRAVDIDAIKADLKKDFKDFCRTGKRKKRKSKDDPKDLRPKCQRGSFWGYWQPRAFVAMGLTIGAGLTMAAFYGIALAKMGPYNDAVDELDAFMADAEAQGCNPKRDPYCTVNDEGVAYADLATEVSKTSAAVRENAIIGDAMLGATVLLAAVLGVIIYQDRADGKRFIRQEKQLRAISDVRVGPMLGKATGAAVGFKF